MITRFFEPKIAVANQWRIGRVAARFSAGREAARESDVDDSGRGDYLLIEMGHNDMKERGEGVGAFTTYKADLKRFIAAAREKGATPILATPVNRLTFDAQGTHHQQPERIIRKRCGRRARKKTCR